MSTNREIVVQDACILFDLIDLGLISTFFQLDLVVMTTPQVIAEIIDPTQLAIVSKYIDRNQLLIDAWGQLDAIDLLLFENKGLSFADSSVLELALRKNAIVLSSDGGLRRVSVKKNLTVSGLLWIVEELCVKNLLSVAQAKEKLEHYPRINRRVPIKEIERLISKLTSSQK